MRLNIMKSAVVGAGTMGSGIAAHLANSGIHTLLLDIVPKELSQEERERGLTEDNPIFRNRIATHSIEAMLKAKIHPFYDPADASLLEPGNLEDDFEKMKEVDWIIEAVPENLNIKRSLFEQLEAIHRPGQIISSNTSGLALSSFLGSRSQEFQKHTFITHFFNPPRYMHLLELVPGEYTDQTLFRAFIQFAERTLGKGVVVAKDTPNFIANRIGIFDMTYAVRLTEEMGLTVGDVDTITGPLIGRPKSAVFRLLDLVGLDVATHVNANLYEAVPTDESREMFRPVKLLNAMVEKGMFGEKNGKGFYFKTRDNHGKRLIKVLNLNTFEYETPLKPRFSSLKALKKIPSVDERLKAILQLDDEVGHFIWKLLSHTLCYAAHRIPEISDSIYGVDAAMRWGFSWIKGPFELWDSIGVRKITERLGSEGREIPPLVNDLLTTGNESFYRLEGSSRLSFNPKSQSFSAIPELSDVLILADLKKSGKVIQPGKTASLLDIGNGIICLEFHTKANTISSNTLKMLCTAVREAETNHQALVIGNQAQNFCLGADLSEMVGAVMAGQFDDINKMIQLFQTTMQTIKFSRVPVVTAIHGMVLGGGCEVSMHSDAILAAAETYMGLVETGVGLIPAGGGCKEWAIRCDQWSFSDDNVELFPLLNKTVEMIGMAKASTSAAHAKKMGYLRPGDYICMNIDTLIHSAANLGRELAELGYRPPIERKNIRVMGRSGIAEFQVRMHMWREGRYISDHDQLIVNKLSYVLCGGNLPKGSRVSEQYLLDLEREAFLSLLGDEKTQARIEHTLKTGKPLRN